MQTAELIESTRWDAPFPPTFFGLFQYDHWKYDNWIAGPYERIGIPDDPLHVDSLPEKAREIVSRVRFVNARFAESPTLQPFEHFEKCRSWMSTWLASDEKTKHEVPDDDDVT